MKRTTHILLMSLLLSLGWSTISQAEAHRAISIRNTDSMWIQGLCSLVFSLDNGGDGEFGNLSVTLQLMDKTGHALSKGTLHVPSFGDSDATRSVNTATEFACDAVENTSTITIIQASEQRDDHTWITLPLETFEPQYYQPLKITLSH